MQEDRNPSWCLCRADPIRGVHVARHGKSRVKFELASKKSRGDLVRFFMTGVQCLLRLLVNQFDLQTKRKR